MDKNIKEKLVLTKLFLRYPENDVNSTGNHQKKGWQPRSSGIRLYCFGRPRQNGRTFHTFCKEEIAISEAHNPERTTSMRSCRGGFEDQFIFRTVLAQILNIL